MRGREHGWESHGNPFSRNIAKSLEIRVFQELAFGLLSDVHNFHPGGIVEIRLKRFVYEKMAGG